MKFSSALLDNHLAQTTMYPFALEVERAEGVWLHTVQGERYMDLISGVGVSNLGHGHSAIRKAIHDQVDRHMHVMVYGEYLQQAQQDAARELVNTLPKGLHTCYFVNSGTEAIEAAIKLARRTTGRSRIISAKGAYHGNTLGAMSISSNEAKKAPFRPLLPDVHFIRYNDPAELELIDERTAAVFLETIQGDAGVRIPDVAWMQALRKRCTEMGTMLILDEIQCGMGRCGTLWAFEQFGIVPDALVLGKALGGGLPVGCLVSSRERMEQFTHDPMLGHISTFAGHPVVCASVAATLRVFREENVLEGVEEKGREIAAQLAAHPAVKEVRQRGYFFAIDLDSEESVRTAVTQCMHDKLITFWFLSCPSSFRIAPPLTISQKETELALEIMLSAIGSSAHQLIS